MPYLYTIWSFCFGTVWPCAVKQLRINAGNLLSENNRHKLHREKDTSSWCVNVCVWYNECIGSRHSMGNLLKIHTGDLIHWRTRTLLIADGTVCICEHLIEWKWNEDERTHVPKEKCQNDRFNWSEQTINDYGDLPQYTRFISQTTWLVIMSRIKNRNNIQIHTHTQSGTTQSK